MIAPHAFDPGSPCLPVFDTLPVRRRRWTRCSRARELNMPGALGLAHGKPWSATAMCTPRQLCTTYSLSTQSPNADAICQAIATAMSSVRRLSRCRLSTPPCQADLVTDSVPRCSAFLPPRSAPPLLIRVAVKSIADPARWGATLAGCRRPRVLALRLQRPLFSKRGRRRQDGTATALAAAWRRLIAACTR